MPHLISKIAEYAVIFNSKNEFLLLQFWENHQNTWHFPGGRLEEGDQSIIALKREVKEKTDLEISNIKPIFTKFYDSKSPKYAVFFTAKVKEPYSVQISDEHQDYKWYNLKDLDKINYKEDFYKEIILEAYKTISN